MGFWLLLLVAYGIIRKLFHEFDPAIQVAMDIWLCFLYCIFLCNKENISFAKQALAENKQYFYVVCITLMFSIFALISVLCSNGSLFLYALGIREFAFYIPLPILVSLYLKKNCKTKSIISVFFVIVIIAGILGIFQYVTDIQSKILIPVEGALIEHSSDFGGLKYISSFFDVPERFALFELSGFVFAYYLILNSKQKKWLAYITVLVTLVSIALCGRRVAMICLFTAAFYILVKSKKYYFGFLILGSMVVSFGWFMNQEPIFLVYVNNTLDNLIFYALQYPFDQMNIAIEAKNVPYFFPSMFGVLSPGSDIDINDTFKLYSDLEFTPARNMIGFGMTFMVYPYVILLLLILQCLKNRTKNFWAEPVLILLCSVGIWNFKSGEFMVWAPLVMSLFGLVLLQREDYANG